MTVYVVQQNGKHDLSSASRYGRIEFIFPEPRYQPSLNLSEARRTVEQALETFDPEQDYIAWAGGDPLGMILIGNVYRGLFPSRPMPMLRWERERDITGNRRSGMGFYTPAVFHP